MTDMETAMIRALASIDDALGMPQDGCNNTAATLKAIALLHSVVRDDAYEIKRLRGALAELAALVRGECPSLLNEDSGGDARLSMEIDELLLRATNDGTATPCEPMFIVRGSDPIGASLVAMWADARETLDETDPKIADARECARNMLVWCAHEALKTPQHALWLLPFEALARELRRRGATVTPVPHSGDFEGAP